MNTRTRLIVTYTYLATWNSKEFKIIVFSPIMLWGKYVIYVSVLNKEQAIWLCGLEIVTGTHMSITARLQMVHPVTQYTDHRGVLYFRHVIRFPGTRVNAISPKPIREERLSVRRFSAYSRRLNSTVYRTLNFQHTHEGSTALCIAHWIVSILTKAQQHCVSHTKFQHTHEGSTALCIAHWISPKQENKHMKCVYKSIYFPK